MLKSKSFSAENLPEDLPRDLDEILKTRFGFECFRPGQFEAITKLLNHGRVICIQPTGHGKSLLYQLPSMLLDGMTIVISPLLALMRDQINHLEHRFQIPAASLNSDQSEEENEVVRQKILQNGVKILFISPEQLGHVDRFQWLAHLPISLIVVDEAHCISTWGHDFRPTYREILKFVKSVSQKNSALKVLGLTATADHKTEADIKAQLSDSASGSDQEVLIQRESMNRPNIHLSVVELQGTAMKLARCKQLLDDLDGNGIIYCATRENTELVSEFLLQQGVSTEAYHAGFESEKKQQLQSDFIHDKYKVLVATNALGMGIDKQNLRFVIHFDMPGSITAYYQEVGRCGRDGKDSFGVLLYDPGDKNIQEYFINSAHPHREDFELVLKIVGESQTLLNLTQIKVESGLHPTRVTVVIAELVEQGLIDKVSEGGKQVYKRTSSNHILNLDRYEVQNQVRTNELKKMMDYSEQLQECRMQLLRRALGDTAEYRCGHCDICSHCGDSKDRVLQKNKILEPRQISLISSWLRSRVTIIDGNKTNRLSDGVAILNGTLRQPLFVQFMKQRAVEALPDFGVSEDLWGLITKQLEVISQGSPIQAIVPIPSRTWKGRDAVTVKISEYLGVPAFPQLLNWVVPPEKRQGELVNNDQRRNNVHNFMMAYSNLPKGCILLLDDYTGSGATLKEAARALRKAGFTYSILPFTIASVRWRLGKAGMI